MHFCSDGLQSATFFFLVRRCAFHSVWHNVGSARTVSWTRDKMHGRGEDRRPSKHFVDWQVFHYLGPLSRQDCHTSFIKRGRRIQMGGNLRAGISSRHKNINGFQQLLLFFGSPVSRIDSSEGSAVASSQMLTDRQSQTWRRKVARFLCAASSRQWNYQ